MDAEEYRMKISRDWKAVVDYAREEGYKRGLAKAEAIGEALGEVLGETRGEIKTTAKIAKAMRDAGIDVESIIKTTGLTEEQITNL